MRIEVTHENRMFEIRYSDGVTRRVEAMGTEELRRKVMDYYKAKNGEVDHHTVQVRTAIT